MIPILLQSHTRALTKIKFNREGDLLFTASKDDTPNVWYAHNGERLGSFAGHNGTVWTLDVTSDSRTLATGSADNTARLWDVSTGKCKHIIETETAVRWVAFSQGDERLALITDATMGKPALLLVYDWQKDIKTPIMRVAFEGGSEKKPTVVAWTDCNEAIITGHQDGILVLWNPETGDKVRESAAGTGHSDQIKDIQFSPDGSYFITASKDTTAKIFDPVTLEVIKSYKTERPVNSAAVSPLRPEVCIAGGQEAIQVTMTNTRSGQFEARFYHQVYGSEMGRVRGHFGPINTIAYRPDGRGYASGGEDGFVRLHTFDPDYYTFDMQQGAPESIIA
jgi:translation initiation factor 3 subunit I